MKDDSSGNSLWYRCLGAVRKCGGRLEVRPENRIWIFTVLLEGNIHGRWLWFRNQYTNMFGVVRSRTHVRSETSGHATSRTVDAFPANESVPSVQERGCMSKEQEECRVGLLRLPDVLGTIRKWRPSRGYIASVRPTHPRSSQSRLALQPCTSTLWGIRSCISAGMRPRWRSKQVTKTQECLGLVSWSA
jgi:hypothetical protein